MISGRRKSLSDSENLILNRWNIEQSISLSLLFNCRLQVRNRILKICTFEKMIESKYNFDF